MKRILIITFLLNIASLCVAKESMVMRFDLVANDSLNVRIADQVYKAPSFKHELVDSDTGLPIFLYENVLSGLETVSSVTIIPEEYVELMPVSESFFIEVAKIDTLTVNWSISEDRSNKMFRLYFKTIYGQNGKVYALKSVKVIINYNNSVESPKLKSGSASFAESSVLSQGKWVKVKVENSGIYQLDYSTLASWGFSDPSKVKVYGNGGDMLPESNSEFREDDLVENSVFDNGRALYFYAKGIVKWQYNASRSIYQQRINHYDKSSYYYITENSHERKSFIEQSNITGVTSSFNEYVAIDYFEQNQNNLLSSGSQWIGESFYNELVSFNTPDIISNNSASIRASIGVVARSDKNSSFVVNINSETTPALTIECKSVTLSSNVDYYADNVVGYFSSSSYSDLTQFQINFLPTSNSAIGWLDYLTLNYDRKLNFVGNELSFRQPNAIGVSEFRMSGIKDKNIIILDVTESVSPIKLNLTTVDDTIRFIADCSVLREFIAFDANSNFSTPIFVENVANQNLHSLPNADYVIVTPAYFLSEARNLASIHSEHNDITPIVITAEQIYNEFSSGKQDPIAIRSFMRMFYSRAEGDSAKMPKYLLLYGDGSYDNLGVVEENRSKLVTYQSTTSFHQTQSYVSDDVFGFLDDNEGNNNLSDFLDIGIGRFVVNNLEEARVANSKVLLYLTAQDNSDWQTRVTFLAQDGDYNLHQKDAEDLSKIVRIYNPEFNIQKIYTDAYLKETSSQFASFPDAEKAIHEALVTNGTLIFNYTGHGSVTAIAYNFLNIAKVDKLNNIKRLPLFVTATCDISRFDNPREASMGEHVFLNPLGGGIGLISTTRVVYSSYNKNLNLSFYKNAFLKDNAGVPIRIGEIIRRTKNGSLPSVNKLNFTLLCDPGLRLNYPKNSSLISEIKDARLNEMTDTIRGLTHGSFKGEVRDNFGVKLANYNGDATITLYDKITKLKTLGNSGQTPFEYESYENILYKGKVKVVDGDFTAEFIVPQDIRYDFGNGKFSIYTTDGVMTNSFGINNSVVIGDLDPFADIDEIGPSIDLFINSYSFKNGGKTGVAPLFISNLFDENSINTAGSGIGHDLLLTIEGPESHAIVVNDFFEFNSNSYQSGVLKYQLPILTPGNYTLSFRSWDCYNNSTEKSINFTVVSDGDLGLENVSLYPNPIKSYETLKVFFNHDEPNTTLNIDMEIFTLDGMQVNHSKFVRIDHNGDLPLIEWSPETSSGLPLGAGIYICRVMINSSSGQQTNFSKRFALLK